MRLKTVLINALVACLSTAIALAAAEGAMRLIGPGGSAGEVVFAAHHALFVEYDPLLGWRLKPNAVGRHKQAEYDISERINADGIRGPDYPRDKPPGEFRIAIVGDSFAEGYTVEFDELFSEVAKRSLNVIGKRPVQVINFGTGGYSTDQEYLKFRRDVLKFKPDLVVLLFHDNDIYYNVKDRYWRGGKPFFELDENGMTLRNVPVPPPERVGDARGRGPAVATTGDARMPASAPKPFAARVKSWLNENSRTYAYLTMRIRATPRLARITQSIGLAEGWGPVEVPEEYGIYSKTYAPQIALAWKTTATIVAHMDAEIQDAGGRFVILHVPPRFGVDREAWSMLLETYDLTNRDWDTGRVELELSAVCRELHIPFIPLSKVLSEPSRKPLYFVRDGHLTAEGHRRVGETLARYIRDNFDS